jgi:hypothetical protein
VESLASGVARRRELEGLAELRAWAEEVRGYRAACERLIAAFDAPRPPSDLKLYEEVKARWARGEDLSEDIEDIIARLQAGGEP